MDWDEADPLGSARATRSYWILNMSQEQLVDVDLTTVTEVFAQAAERFGDADALVTEEDTLSYAQWWQQAGGVAAELRHRGIGRGDVVAIILPSSIAYATSYV